MNDNEILRIWKAYDTKLDEVLKLNKETAYEVTKSKLHKTMNSLRMTKSMILLLGIPYSILLSFLTFITFKSGAFIMMLGFGIITLVNIAIIIRYIYHIVLINKINRSDQISVAQKRIAELKISNHNTARIAIFQLPFWSICWISIEGLKNDPILYGGVNFLVFLVLSCFAFSLYNKLELGNNKISRFILSGYEWEMIDKSSDILEQLKKYK